MNSFNLGAPFLDVYIYEGPIREQDCTEGFAAYGRGNHQPEVDDDTAGQMPRSYKERCVTLYEVIL